MTTSSVIHANAGIHKIIQYFFVFTYLFGFFIFAPQVFADAKTDYEYQYGQYRIRYPEYVLLKSDYLNTPSLDNQQKVMIAAKQSILARDLAKASFAWYLMDLISLSKANYEPAKPIVAALASAREFFLQKAQVSQGIVTQADLADFTSAYVKGSLQQDRMVKYGILAHKLSALVRIQLDSQAALNTLVTQLPTDIPAPLIARIEELRASTKIIDEKIDLIAHGLNITEEPEAADAEIFFSSRVEKLLEIKILQLDWINRLIDIDKNYAQPNR